MFFTKIEHYGSFNFINILPIGHSVNALIKNNPLIKYFLSIKQNLFNLAPLFFLLLFIKVGQT